MQPVSISKYQDLMLDQGILTTREFGTIHVVLFAQKVALSSMTLKLLQTTSHFTRQHLGVVFSVRASGGHVDIHHVDTDVINISHGFLSL